MSELPTRQCYHNINIIIKFRLHILNCLSRCNATTACSVWFTNKWLIWMVKWIKSESHPYRYLWRHQQSDSYDSIAITRWKRRIEWILANKMEFNSLKFNYLTLSCTGYSSSVFSLKKSHIVFLKRPRLTVRPNVLINTHQSHTRIYPGPNVFSEVMLSSQTSQ